MHPVRKPAATEVADPAAQASRESRIAVLDALRGIAIVLVVLSHGWVLWPIEWIDERAWVRPWFRSGNTAVTVFLVASGYLTFRALSPGGQLRRMRPGVTFLRRVLRVGPSLWVLLGLITLVWLVDPTDDVTTEDHRASSFRVLTYTWNWYVQSNLVTSRPDFGHLWYLSVDMQAFVVVAGLLYALRRRRVGVVPTLLAVTLLVTWWRFHVLETEFVFQVLVRTTVRMDGFLIGALAGSVLALVPPGSVKPQVSRLTGLAGLALLPLSFWYASTDERYLRWGSTLLALNVCLLIGAAALGVAGSTMPRWTSWRPLTWLGANSLALYIWHYPVFTFVQRHTDGWSWQARTVVGLAATAAVFAAAYLLVERYVARWPQSPRWRIFDDGVALGLLRIGRRLVELARTMRAGRSADPGSAETDPSATGDTRRTHRVR